MSNGVYGHDCRGTLVQDTGHGDILLYRDRMSSFISRWFYKLTPEADPVPVDLSEYDLELTLHDTNNNEFITVPVGTAAGEEVSRNYFTQNPGRREGTPADAGISAEPETVGFSILSVPFEESTSGHSSIVVYGSTRTESGSVSVDGAAWDGVESASLGGVATLAFTVYLTQPGDGPFSLEHDPALNVVDSYPPATLQAGTVYRMWVTVEVVPGQDRTITLRHQMPLGILGTNLAVFDIDAYPGPYQPGRAWGDGEQAPQGLIAEWAGAPLLSESIFFGSGPAEPVIDPINNPEVAEFLATRTEGKWHLNAYRNGWSERISDGYWVVTP